jgi:hypothetical protein
MDWTWSQVFSLAQVQSGLLGRGQVANASILNDSILMASLLLDEWDGQGLALPDINTGVTFNCTAGTAKYLLGKDALGVAGATSIRPETIVTATLTLVSSPVQRVQLTDMGMAAYTLLPIPSTQSMPFNYALNRKWPQAEFYLYPTPDKAYPVTLNSKVKWADTITAPDINPFAVAQVPSGFPAALVANIALKLAKRYRMETPTLINDAESTRFTLMSQVYRQYRSDSRDIPDGIFSDTLLKSGLNP